MRDTASAISRRAFLRTTALALPAVELATDIPWAQAAWDANPLPNEPLEIADQPQFLFDLYVVDCTWAVKEKHDPVKRVFHPCVKHPGNPLMTGDQPSHFWVVRDKSSGMFRLWYQLNKAVEFKDHPREKGQAQFHSYIAYAESGDGLHWEKPTLDLFTNSGGGHLPRNAVLFRPDTPQAGFDAPQIVTLPQQDQRGYAYVMLYRQSGRGGGIRLIGSRDGIHWDEKSDTVLSMLPSDHHNTVVYDTLGQQYVMYVRAKHIYLASGQGREKVDTGQSRRGVARMTSKELWTAWTSAPQTILMPDEVDAEHGYNYFYGMPVFPYAGIYWGFLQSFRLNDFMHSELAWSRDGVRFDRMPQRPKVVQYGEEGSWDDTMILACPSWVEVGDQWWIYYNGWDGPHGTAERTGGIGLAKLRKEGFISLRGPTGGGVVCTRQVRWPGGTLVINANATGGELRVRVSDARRRPLPGFDYADGQTFSGDEVAHEVRWKGKSLQELQGQVIRLEFFLKEADLYTFRAAPHEGAGASLTPPSPDAGVLTASA